MEDLGIEFSKIFLEKHGNQAFKNLTNQIKSEIIVIQITSMLYLQLLFLHTLEYLIKKEYVY